MTIDVIWKELMDLITAIFRGTSFLTLVSVMGIFATAYTQIKKYILKKQSALIKEETEKIAETMFTKIYKKQGGKPLHKNSKHREIGK